MAPREALARVIGGGAFCGLHASNALCALLLEQSSPCPNVTMLLAIPCRYTEGDMATVAGWHYILSLGTFLRQVHTSSDDGQSRAHVKDIPLTQA